MNKLKSRKAMAAVVAGVAVVGGGGAAIASAQSDSTSPQAFFDSVAKHLGISTEELEDATKAAAIDLVCEAARERGIDVVFTDNDVLPLPNQPDLDEALRELAEAAVEPTAEAVA